MENLPNSREEAIAQGSSWYFTGKVCKNGHTSKRYIGGYCYDCAKANNYRYKMSCSIEKRRERMLAQIRRQCKREGIDFNLTVSDIDWVDKCPVFGTKLIYLNYGKKVDKFKPSFDRIDPAKGYVKGNVRIISSKANTMKTNATLEDIRNLLSYMESCTT